MQKCRARAVVGNFVESFVEKWPDSTKKFPTKFATKFSVGSGISDRLLVKLRRVKFRVQTGHVKMRFVT